MKTFGFTLVVVLCGSSLASAQAARWTDCRLLSSYTEGHDDSSRRPDDGMLSDRFGRNVVLTGITLVDWEGHAGNPELTHFLYPPQRASFPVTATVTVE